MEKRTDIEIWKPIAGYEGYYEVSNHGNVRSVDRIVGGIGDHKLKGKNKAFCLAGPKIKKYWYVNLYKGGKGLLHSVHRQVAIAHVPNPLNLPHVNHKDLDQLNNHYSNLEWCTHRENISHASVVRKKKSTPVGVSLYDGKTKKSWAAIMNGKYLGTFSSQDEASKAYQTAVKIKDGKENVYAG